MSSISMGLVGGALGESQLLGGCLKTAEGQRSEMIGWSGPVGCGYSQGLCDGANNHVNGKCRSNSGLL